MKFGKRIKSLRKLKGLSLTDLAKKVMVSKGYLSHIESDKGNPTIFVISQLLTHLDARFELIGPDNIEVGINRCDECPFFAVDDHGTYASGYSFCQLWLKFAHEYPNLFPGNGVVTGEKIPKNCPLKLVRFVVGGE